jgi:hypothetical protein
MNSIYFGIKKGKKLLEKNLVLIDEFASSLFSRKLNSNTFVVSMRHCRISRFFGILIPRFFFFRLLEGIPNYYFLSSGSPKDHQGPSGQRADSYTQPDSERHFIAL